MDPNATLNEIRELFADAPEASDVADKFNALDAWLSSGGFLPRSWDLSVARIVQPREPEAHETIWCDHCAKGNHNFRVPANNDAESCFCCGSAKPEGV